MNARPTTYRMRVLAVVEASSSPLTGREIASACGLTYKQVIDALNALYNHGKVDRQGRKFTARWTRVQQSSPVSQRHHLDLVMFLIVNQQIT